MRTIPSKEPSGINEEPIKTQWDKVGTQENPKKANDRDRDIDIDRDKDSDGYVEEDTHKERDTKGNHTSLLSVFDNELPREERIKQQQKLLYEQLEALEKCQ